MEAKARLIAKIWNMVSRTHNDKDYEDLKEMTLDELEEIHQELIDELT